MKEEKVYRYLMQ